MTDGQPGIGPGRRRPSRVEQEDLIHKSGVMVAGVKARNDSHGGGKDGAAFGQPEAILDLREGPLDGIPFS